MRLIARAIEKTVLLAARGFPAVVITGPRRAGKTTLLRKLYPKAQHILLDDPNVLDLIRSDVRSFIEGLRPPVVLDEIQNAPELFAYIKARIDARPHRMGQWFFTGSQEYALMKGVTESLAGRAAILGLLPLSIGESSRVEMVSGGFPEVIANPKSRSIWFQSYLQSYLERDVRAVTNVRDLPTFRRFLSLVASRQGQMLNKTDLAAPLEMSVPAIGEWLSVLEITGQIVTIPPYFENFGKRLVKSPKIYWVDSGLVCHLLGIDSAQELEKSPFLGAIFEGFVATEILKSQVNAGRRGELYYFRDRQGLEVDFLLPRRDARVWLIECKAGRTVHPASATSMDALARAMKSRVERSTIVHRAAKTPPPTSAVTLQTKAMDVAAFVKALSA